MNYDIKHPERLDQVIAALKAIPKDQAKQRFNMSDWFLRSDDLFDDDGTLIDHRTYGVPLCGDGEVKELVTECGTAGCLAGWTLAVLWDEITPALMRESGNIDNDPNDYLFAADLASLLLGIDTKLGGLIFHGHFSSDNLEDITLEQGIAAFELLRAGKLRIEKGSTHRLISDS